VKKRVVAVLLVLALGTTAALLVGCGGKLPKDALAKVGDTVITQKQLDERVAEFEAQYAGYVPDKQVDPEGYKSFQMDVLEYLVTYELVRQKAKSLDVSVTDQDVQTEIDAIINDSFNGDQAAFEKALAEQKLTLDAFKRGYKESLLMQRAYEKVTKGITTVPDDEIAAYYDANKDYYFVDETRTARHILIAPVAGRVNGTTTTTTAPTTTTTTGSESESESTGLTITGSSTTSTTAKPTEADWTAALETAQMVRAQLVAGGDWTELAKRYSDDPGSKNLGGDLGTVSKGETVPEFDTALFSLAKDEISQPVKTSYGYHIIQVTGINPAKQYSLEEVKEDITNVLLNEKKSKAWTEWVQKTKQEIGVIYAEGWQPTTTTTQPAATTETTAATEPGATTESTEPAPTTTASPEPSPTTTATSSAPTTATTAVSTTATTAD
jgi:parvulin-like peptidyl-prolyl isomerase